MEKRRLCGSGSGVWGLGGAGDGETQVQEWERALLATLLGCSESGKGMNWREKRQPVPFPSGMCTWEDVLLCCHGSSLGHLLYPEGLWGPTAGGDVCVGFTVLAQGEVLRMEGARLGLPPAWGGSGVPGSPVAGMLWECFCRGGK